MVYKTPPLILEPSKEVQYEKAKDVKLFIGEWTDQDTAKLCNPRLYRGKYLEEKKEESKKHYHAKKSGK
jgi:hypothetical protein